MRNKLIDLILLPLIVLLLVAWPVPVAPVVLEASDNTTGHETVCTKGTVLSAASSRNATSLIVGSDPCSRLQICYAGDTFNQVVSPTENSCGETGILKVGKGSFKGE